VNARQSSWKLTTGCCWDAWKTYHKVRAEIAHFPKGPPIFISGTHRSGTTWVARMLAVPGLWYSHEPFNPNKNIWHESFTYVRDTESNSAVDSVMEQVLAGGLRQTAMNGPVDHPLMPLRMFRPPIQRIMIKDPLACLLTGYFAARYDLQTLVLFRHPCGFVSSVTRLGWPTGGFLKDFLGREQLIADHLSPYVSLMEKYANQKSIAAAAVLHGVMNKAIWNMVQTHSLKWTLFEDLCADPIEKFKKLFEWFNLPYGPDTRLHHERLCSNGSANSADYQPHAVARNSSAMARSWRKHLSRADAETVREIWRQFDLPLYLQADEWL